LGIGVGEVLTDVTESGCPEQSVDDSVCDCIGVAVAMQAATTIEDDTSEHQWASYVVTEPMDVETLSDSNGHHVTSHFFA
jgi:hypothetical protein